MLAIAALSNACIGATTMPRYYAHGAVEDKYGVVAPWYKGLNGQCDYRVRIAAETLKRYPWADTNKAMVAAPEFAYNSSWKINTNGAITVPPVWSNGTQFAEWLYGDLGQRAAVLINSMVDYYRYSGDPVALAIIEYQAEVILKTSLTPADNPWPGIPVTVPIRGKAYGKCDPHGMIQLDMLGQLGQAFVRAYEVTLSERLLEAAKHWADVLAQKSSLKPGASPWGRYANPEDCVWKDNDKQTGGVVFILYFLDELIRHGYNGTDNAIVKARDAGRAYLRDVLLPAWTVDDTWGRHYWDWPQPTQSCVLSQFACQYMMDNKECFPNWRTDVRNILSVFLNRVGVNPESNGDAYSGAWAYPESSTCCWRSLWYAPMEMAWAYAQYGAEADSEWGREMARRQQILGTYDAHDTGVVEDGIDGGAVVTGDWFCITHMAPIRFILNTMAWQPEILGANRENHIMRSTATISSVVYGKGRVAYSTFDSPPNTVDVLRLAFVPVSVKADGQSLKQSESLTGNGYLVKKLTNGDCIVEIRHDGARSIVVEGDDPQQIADDGQLVYEGKWDTLRGDSDFGSGIHQTDLGGAGASYSFIGSQVRLVGRVDDHGGRADVYLDGEKQLVPIDFWNKRPRSQQILYYRSGLSSSKHTLKIVARGERNPYSKGTCVYIDALQWSDAVGNAGFGEGGGPTDTQRMIFGYTGRQDYVDKQGNKWRPATEWVSRLGAGADSVAVAWWTEPTKEQISGTDDPDLYRYGVHAPRIITNLTVGPGQYHVRLKFAATRGIDAKTNCVTVSLNGRKVVSKMDVAATAGGSNKAVDLMFNSVSPRNGIIEIELVGGAPASGKPGEAFLQAVEIGPGQGDSSGVTPVCVNE